MDTRISNITDPSIIVPADNCTDLFFNLFNNLYDGLCLFEFSPTGKVKALYLNESYFDAVGYTKEQYLPYFDNITVTLFEEDEEKLIGLVRKSLSEGTGIFCHVRGYRYDGSVGWFSIRATQIDFVKSDNPVYLTSINDITDIIETSHQLTINRARFKLLEETSNVYIFEYSPQTDVMTFSPGQNRPDIRVEAYSSYLRRNDQLYPLDAICFFSALSKAIRKEYKGFTDVRSYNREKTDLMPFRLYYSSIADDSGTVISVVGRIEMLKEGTAHFLSESNDSRCGILPAPSEAMPLIEKKIESHADNAFMLMIDIDDFAEFNDRYGEENASNAISLAASMIGSIFSGAVIFRYIGDEFAVFAEGLTERELYDRIDKLRAALATMELEINGEKVNTPLTLSIGASWAANSSKTNIKDYFITADKALLTAKREGKNRLESVKIFF